MPVIQITKPQNVVQVKPLAFYQKKANISTKKLSEITGIPRVTLKSCKLGCRILNDKNAKILADIFNIEPEELKKEHVLLPIDIANELFTNKKGKKKFDMKPRYEILSYKWK